MIRPELSSHTIVLVGKFAPSIFHPSWFANAGLIRKNQTDAAKIAIFSYEIVKYSIEWLDFTAQLGRITLTTAQEAYFEPLRDLVLGTFSILDQTPIQMLGINYQMHFTASSTLIWDDIEKKLRPSESAVSELPASRLESIRLSSVRPYNGFPGVFNFVVEPSSQFPDGVFISSNDHYEIKPFEDSMGSHKVLDIIESEWQNSKGFLTEYNRRLMEKH
jgi:hypothetical protein